MKIESSLVKKLVITDIAASHHLDPISVYLEDYGYGMGKITISCFNESWSYYWESMGKDTTLEQFFTKCDNNYLSGKLAPELDRKIIDEDNIESHAKKEIFRMRKCKDLTRKQARDLYDCCDKMDVNYIYDYGLSNALQEIHGENWNYCLPKKINPKYQYLCDIINVVKEALNGNIS